MSESTQYAAPLVSPRWADVRETHIAVATAIHAIADSSRSADEIWEAPTDTDWKRVAAAVSQYVRRGTFPAEPDGDYPWGQETLVCVTREFN